MIWCFLSVITPVTGPGSAAMAAIISVETKLFYLYSNADLGWCMFHTHHNEETQGRAPVNSSALWRNPDWLPNGPTWSDVRLPRHSMSVPRQITSLVFDNCQCLSTGWKSYTELDLQFEHHHV